ncbi:hypothetical protein [Streptomyces lannensis]|uniref:hypothetical protein n=1 Tax=Streptomyces lannensis TaxID=766498 RepID=UPI0031EB122F
MLLVVFVTVVAPRYLLSWDAPSTPAADRAKAVNDIRTTLLQGLAGVALLIGAFFVKLPPSVHCLPISGVAVRVNSSSHWSSASDRRRSGAPDDDS